MTCRNTTVHQLLDFPLCSSHWIVALLNFMALALLHCPVFADFLCCFWLPWADLAQKSCGRCTPFSSLQFWGLFGDYLMLPVFGRNMTGVSADSPWKLLYNFAGFWEVRRAAPVSVTANVTLIQLCSGRSCTDGWMSPSQGPRYMEGSCNPMVSLPDLWPPAFMWLSESGCLVSAESFDLSQCF